MAVHISSSEINQYSINILAQKQKLFPNSDLKWFKMRQTKKKTLIRNTTTTGIEQIIARVESVWFIIIFCVVDSTEHISIYIVRYRYYYSCQYRYYQGFYVTSWVCFQVDTMRDC